MKLIRFCSMYSNKDKYGMVEGEDVYVVKGAPFGKIKPTTEKYQLKEIKILPPTVPTKIKTMQKN